MGSGGRAPDFVIVGAMKAGTTSVASNLSLHPEIFVPPREVHFCNRYWERGQDWYYAWFTADAVCGEKSPKYMLRRRFMSRLHEVAPKARIVASLRDPTARFLSHVNMKIERGNLPPTPVVTAAYLRRHVLAHEGTARDMLDRGAYHTQITRNILPFYPEERLFLNVVDDATRGAVAAEAGKSDYSKNLTAQDPSGDTRAALRRMAAFVGAVEPEFFDRAPVRVENIRHYRFEVAGDALDLVREHYAEENKRLFAYLGRELPGW